MAVLLVHNTVALDPYRPLLALGGSFWKFGLDRKMQRGMLRLGLFWRFLDVVWVGLFSVVYLGMS